jgi:hypothetical protein
MRVCAAMICLLGIAVSLAAQPAKPVDGSLVVGDRTYKLTNAAAFETMYEGKEAVAVVASDRRLPTAQVKAALGKIENSTNALGLSQPYLLILFSPAGEPMRSAAAANSGGYTMNGDDLKSDVKIENGRVRGQSTLPALSRASFKMGFDIRLDVAIGAENAPKAIAKPAGPVKPSVSGTFMGNGKAAKLAFVSALPDEPFNDKPSIKLIFTEKDHSKEKRPSLKAAFGDFGSSLIISLHEDGSIFGCQVAHAAHKNQGFSSIGNIRTTAFEVADGRVEGQIETDGEADTFGDKWSVDLKFTAPYGPAAAKAATTTPPSAKTTSPANKTAGKPPIARPGTKPAVPKSTSPKSTAAKPTTPKNAKPTGKTTEPAGALTAKQIPLSKDATDVRYQEPEISYKSASSVRAVAGELAKALAAQGWKGQGPDIIADELGVMTRTRGASTLSVVIQADGAGSEVAIIPTDVAWEAETK